MDNKLINKALNYILIMLFIVFFLMIIFNIIEPLMYNINVKTKGENINKSPYIYSALDKYIYAIKRENVKGIDGALALVKRKSDKVYNEYSNYINKNFKTLNIISISEIDSKKVLVKYKINDEVENSVIIKFYGNTDTFKIYYDEKLENI